MTFEEDFPSLIKEIDFTDVYVSHETDYLKEILQITCLDKQRVREAIEKQYSSLSETSMCDWTDDEHLAFGICMTIQKELGL